MGDEASPPKRVLVVVGGHAYPPSSSGAATILYHLFGNLPEGVEVLTGAPNRARDASLGLVEHRVPDGRLARWRLLWRGAALEGLVRFLLEGRRLARERAFDEILLVFPDTPAFLAGYVLARRMGIPYSVYLIDLLADSRLNRLERILLARHEEAILAGARVVFCLSEAIAEHYGRTVDRDYVIVRHALPEGTGPEDGRDSRARPAAMDRVTIVFSGQIHDISRDALRNLIEAVRRLDEPRWRVSLLTNRSPEYLKEEGLWGDFVETDFVTGPRELHERLGSADILFSPVAFRSGYPEQARTCFPTKTFDYIRAGVPILVHAPGDSFYARYMEEHGAALCVTRPDPAELATALRTLATDDPLRRQVVGNASRMAEERHDLTDIRRRFETCLFQEGADGGLES